jgi:hypothetical protein
MKRTATLLLLVSILFVLTSCAKEYKKGIVTSTTYESEFLNLKFTAPTGYTIKNEEAGVDVQQYFSKTVTSAAYEMEAFTSNTYPYAAVTLEKTDMTADTYVKKVENASVADGKYTIAGEEYIKMTKKTDSDSTSEVYCRTQDGYLISIIIQYTPDTASQKDTLLNAFTALK